MTKKYKVWIIIEELVEEGDRYEEITDEAQNVGPEFETLFEAAALRDRLLDCATDDGEVVWLPPLVSTCPKCRSKLMPGPNGCIICSQDACDWWQE